MNDYRLDVKRADLPVHQPVPYLPAEQAPAPLVPTGQTPAPVQTVQLPDGRIVSGYAVGQPPAERQPEKSQAISPLAVNIALGGVGFAAVCGGLTLLTGVIAALAAFVHQLMILAAVIFGGWVAIQVLGSTSSSSGVTVNAKKAVFKRNNFNG